MTRSVDKIDTGYKRGRKTKRTPQKWGARLGSGSLPLELLVGLEPTACALRMRCSTN